MGLLISQSSSTKSLPLSVAQLKKISALTLKALKASAEFKRIKDILGEPRDLELYFCDDAEMRDYQRKFRKLDRTTDVLSFPSFESPDNVSKGFLGSLIVSLATVSRNAKRYKKTFAHELAEVLVHGILHLYGFDHVRVSPKKRRRMLALQKEITKDCLKALRL